MARLDKDAIADLLDKNPLADIIGKKVKLGRPNGKGVCDGPCLCEPQKGKSPLWVTPSHRWGCFKNSACGGDTFDYLRVHEGLEFRAAIERLGGAETVEADPTAVAEARAQREEDAAARRRREASLAEDERRRAFAIWETGASPEGSLVADYFAHRGLTLPDTPSLRFAPDEVYWWTAGEKPLAIYSGPCMLGAIQGRDDRFAAVHRTWLDPRLGTDAMPPWGLGEGMASGKAQILAPDGSPAGNVKKMRGTKKGGAIRLGAERAKVAKAGAPAWQRGIGNVRPWMLDPDHKVDSDQPATEEAARWAGWGTALRPAMEPAVLARKPLSGTVAETVLDHGTGALNIDGSLIGEAMRSRSRSTGDLIGGNTSMAGGNYARRPAGTVMGNWPANVMHDGSPSVVDAFPPDASGSRARFFYGAKADADDRIGSKHPTVKPVDLMRWLVKLVTPPGGTVLDPFAGTGGTGEAAWREGFSAVLIEREADYREDIARRMALALAGPALRRARSAKARGDGADAGPLFGGSSMAGGGAPDLRPLCRPGQQDGAEQSARSA